MPIFTSMLLCVPVCFALNSCSDDDDSPNPGSGKQLMSIMNVTDGYAVFKDAVYENGKLVSFSEGDDNYNYNYRLELRGKEASIIETSSDGEPYTVDLTIENGLATSADFSDEIYDFQYTKDKIMSGWENGETSCCKIKFDADGDIIEGDIISTITYICKEQTWRYTDSKVTSPIPNKGNIKLYGKWDIMYDYEYYTFFDVFGNGPKHLPVKVGNCSYDWTLDSDGYPTKVLITYTDGEYKSDQELSFTWK